MGWTVLYIAFGVVALWLLGEVLLQYKARLRWRLLAFGGFLCVVAGAVIPSIVVIGLGIAAFATGQTFVTLSYRRGFSTGWALGGIPSTSRRRRGAGAPPEAEPAHQSPDLAHAPDEHAPAEYGEGGPDTVGFAAAGGNAFGPESQGADPYGPRSQEPPVYQPAPVPMDETSPYGIYALSSESPGQQGIYAEQQYGPGDGQQYDQGFGLSGQPQYAAYTDPYIGFDGASQGGGAYAPAASYDQQPPYDPYGGGVSFDPQGNIAPQPPYGDPGGYGSDGYGMTYGDEFDAFNRQPSYSSYGQGPQNGGWVPQQRDPNDPLGDPLTDPLQWEQQGQPGQQPYPPHQNGYDGYYYDEQRGGY